MRLLLMFELADIPLENPKRADQNKNLKHITAVNILFQLENFSFFFFFSIVYFFILSEKLSFLFLISVLIKITINFLSA